MKPLPKIERTRRWFFEQCGVGLGRIALAGLFTRAIRTVPRWVWIVPLLMWLSVALVNAETPRFREPLEPFFIIAAACALEALARRAGATPSVQRVLGFSARPAHAVDTATPPGRDPAQS